MMKSSFKIPTYIIYDNAPPLSQNETYKSLQLCLYILVALKPKVKFLSTVFLSSAFSVYSDGLSPKKIESEQSPPLIFAL